MNKKIKQIDVKELYLEYPNSISALVLTFHKSMKQCSILNRSYYQFFVYALSFIVLRCTQMNLDNSACFVVKLCEFYQSFLKEFHPS